VGFLILFLDVIGLSVERMNVKLLYYHNEWQIHFSERPNAILSSFSLYKNVKELIGIRSGGDMDCLHGIRTMSMMWVVLCHTYINSIQMPDINLIEFSNVSISVVNRYWPDVSHGTIFNRSHFPKSFDW